MGTPSPYFKRATRMFLVPLHDQNEKSAEAKHSLDDKARIVQLQVAQMRERVEEATAVRREVLAHADT